METFRRAVMFSVGGCARKVTVIGAPPLRRRNDMWQWTLEELQGYRWRFPAAS